MLGSLPIASLTSTITAPDKRGQFELLSRAIRLYLGAAVRAHLYFGVAAVGLLVAGCTVLPGLNEATGGIPISEIVLRIKCELSDAFTEPQDIDQPEMSWLKNWTAQINLSLEVLDSATLAPGASVMQPFHNAYGVVAGPSSRSVSGVPGTSLAAIPQGFVAAAGVSLNGQASRTETLEFVFSLAELKRWRTEHDTARLCAISDNMDLRGRLGLKEWVTQALEPVRSNLLYAGYHPKPQSTPQGQSQKSSSPQPAPRNAVTSPLVPLLAVRKCTPGDVQNIKNALSDLNSADNALLDSSLVNVQESIESLSKNQSTSLDLANGDFSKAIDSLKTKAADSEQYIPVLDQLVLSKLNAVATFVNRLYENKPY